MHHGSNNTAQRGRWRLLDGFRVGLNRFRFENLSSSLPCLKTVLGGPLRLALLTEVPTCSSVPSFNRIGSCWGMALMVGFSLPTAEGSPFASLERNSLAVTVLVALRFLSGFSPVPSGHCLSTCVQLPLLGSLYPWRGYWSLPPFLLALLTQAAVFKEHFMTPQESDRSIAPQSETLGSRCILELRT